MQKLLTNPPVLVVLLDQEIAALDRLVDRAMKKKPQSVKREEKAEAVGV